MRLSRCNVVSVLLPVRNAAATLPVALRSVLRSRGVELEVVVVEHASDDASPEIAARFAARDTRVRVVTAGRDVDLAGALALGRRACTAAFIARMDADDVMHPDRLAADAAHLERSDAAAVACRVKLLPRSTARGALASYVAWQNASITAEDHAREIWIEQPLCNPATTFRASAFDAAGGWRTPADGPEDYDLFLRLVAAGGALEKRPAVHHGWRRHPLTTTRFSRDALAALKARALVARFGLAARRVVVAGAGKEGGRIARALIAAGARPAAFVDVAVRRIGRLRHGVEVLPASSLASLHASGGVFLIGAVGTSGARGVVRAQLAGAGFVEGVDCVVVA